MAHRLLDVLIIYKTSKIPLPTATVYLRGKGPSVDIPGTNCGFFAYPVITMAALDCRRSLQFFGLTRHPNKHCLTPIGNRRANDLGIENFGLPRVTPAQLIQVVSTLISVPPEPILTELYEWSSKQIAHFTTSQPIVSYQSIRDASIAMIEAYNRFLFDALGRPRPTINPSPT